jgi:UDP-glucuronate 4-epimerase
VDQQESIKRRLRILVTGAAGFIGFHLVNRLLHTGHIVTGVDNLNDYYPVELKLARLAELGIKQESIELNKGTNSHLLSGFTFWKAGIEDKAILDHIYQQHQPDIVVNLAAQVGVRYSLINPEAYIKSNLTGFSNILECCRHHHVSHLVFASSSSVYGLNQHNRLSVDQNVDHPISLYAATKKSNELMAHSYSHLFHLPVTGLRFFTVYGPWGRPDMAMFLFTQNILNRTPLDLFNHGEMERDFTFVDDIVEGLIRVMLTPPLPDPNWNPEYPDPSSSSAPYRLYNIGNQTPVKLIDFIREIEKTTGVKAKLNYLPLQPGDVLKTCADIGPLYKKFGFEPQTPISVGVAKFVEWYREFYKV